MKNFRSLLIGSLLVATASSANAAGVHEMKGRTALLASRYLKIWSSSNVTPIVDVPNMYRRTVLFYGKHYTHADLKAEKRRAILRWPIRHYAHRPGSMEIDCSVVAQRCTARSTIDFAVANPNRGTKKCGSAKFALGVSFAGPHSIIFYESGSLNNRRSRTSV